MCSLVVEALALFVDIEVEDGASFDFMQRPKLMAALEALGYRQTPTVGEAVTMMVSRNTSHAAVFVSSRSVEVRAALRQGAASTYDSIESVVAAVAEDVAAISGVTFVSTVSVSGVARDDEGSALAARAAERFFPQAAERLGLSDALAGVGVTFYFTRDTRVCETLIEPYWQEPSSLWVSITNSGAWDESAESLRDISVGAEGHLTKNVRALLEHELSSTTKTGRTQ